jgi:hypothetical protein
MTDVTAADLLGRIAAEFDRRGWPYDPGLGERLLAGLEPGTNLEPAIFAQRLPADYLDRNGIGRDELAAALADLGGLTLVAARSTQTLVVNDNRYQVNLSDQAQIKSSNLNLGGSQINVSVETPKEEVLAALRLLLSAAFAGDWHEGAFGELAQHVDGREDITAEDVRALTAEVGAEQQADPGRIRQLLDKVATGTLTGTLTTGLSAGLGQLLANPPL